MTAHDRRDFLAAAMAAVGFTATSSWTERWFQPQDPQDPQDPAGSARERQLRAAVAKAKAEGKPLLVFVVPPVNDPAVDARGSGGQARGFWIGAFLNHGGAAALLDVALCVPACAQLEEVKRVTGAATIDGLPLLLRIDVAGADGAPPPRVTRLDLDLGALEPEREVGATYEERAAAAKRHVAAALARLAAQLHQIVQPDADSLATLAQAVHSKLTEREQAELAGWLAGGERPNYELLVRCTAEVRRVAADRADGQRATILQVLGEGIEREIVKQPVPGSRWYRGGPCIWEPETQTPEESMQGGSMCGMGSVPAYCERFLDLYSQL